MTRLCEQWQDEQKAFARQDLSAVDYVYCWADGIHVNIRLEQEKLFLLVLIGVRADGSKELITLADGFRESTESWADLLRNAKRRGTRAPVLPSATARSGSGRRYARCSPRPGRLVLVPRHRECSCRDAQVSAPGGEEHAR